jgi:hypothetical protein
MARDCQLSCDFATHAAAPSYVCKGGCGECVVFGVSVVLEARHVPEGACPQFRAELLRIFGAGGPRRLDATREPVGDMLSYETGLDGVRRLRQGRPEPMEPNDGIGFQPNPGLGRAPMSQVDDQAVLEAFGRMSRRF